MDKQAIRALFDELLAAYIEIASRDGCYNMENVTSKVVDYCNRLEVLLAVQPGAKPTEEQEDVLQRLRKVI